MMFLSSYTFEFSGDDLILLLAIVFTSVIGSFFGILIGEKMQSIVTQDSENNAKNNVVNESGKTKVDNTRQRVPTNYKKVDFWGPNKPRKK